MNKRAILSYRIFNGLTQGRRQKNFQATEKNYRKIAKTDKN